MSVVEIADHVVDLIKETKEKYVASKPEDTDMATYIQLIRDDKIVATLMLHADRDKMLEACMKAAFCFSVDAICVSFETLHTALKENPVTHSAWEAGEMQWVAEAEGGREKGWVTDAVTILAYDREGNSYFHTLPFQIEDDKVIWLEAQRFASEEDNEETKSTGYVDDVMKEIMAQETMRVASERATEQNPMAQFVLADILAREDGEQHRWFHEDMAAMRVMAESGLIIGMSLESEEGTTRARLIDERRANPRAEDPFTILENA